MASLSEAEIMAWIGHDPAVFAAMMSRAKEVESYWKELASSGEFKAQMQHILKNGIPEDKIPAGYTEHPGDYERSIHTSFDMVDGHPRFRVAAADYKSPWIEFGSKHMPKFALAAKVRAHFEGGG